MLMSHHEGNSKDIASNHGDVKHIWDKFGLTMNQFRKDLKKTMSGAVVSTVPVLPVDNSSDDTSKQKASTSGTGYYRVCKKWADAGSQIGAFKNKENAIELCRQNSEYKIFENSSFYYDCSQRIRCDIIKRSQRM